jgi:hypothetical protein
MLPIMYLSIWAVLMFKLVHGASLTLYQVEDMNDLRKEVSRNTLVSLT